jgi:GT2 family glycosyltransferase
VFEDLKGFDTRFFAHQEEIDLCWRAFRKGISCWYAPDSVVYHVGGATLSESNPHKTYLNFRNSLWMLTKNLPASWLMPILFSRLCLDGLAGIQYLFQRKPAHTWAIIRAHGGFYGLLPTLLKERKGPFPMNYYHTFSVVANYYLKGKKRFTQLK